MTRLAWLAATIAVLALSMAGCPGRHAAQTSQEPQTDPALTADTGPAAKEGVSGKLTIDVPCGMIIPVQAVMSRFEELNPEVEVIGEFDNANILVDKLINKGAKADVYISPGETEIGRLGEEGLLDVSAAETVGTFELVVIVNRNSPLEIATLQDLKKCSTISTPDPAENSVGASGKQALEHLGLWDELQPKMLRTKRAIQSHLMVASGKSDAGVAYRNCPLETNPEKLSTTKVAVAFAFPEDSYERQRCLVGALKNSSNPPAAKAFVDFIASEEGRKLLADNGMTGCLDMQASAAPADARVKVQAFYPGNEDHKPLRDLIEGLSDQYDGRVVGQFIDFTSDDGFKKWRGAGLSCGSILINGKQTWTWEKDGAKREVTFMMAQGGEWTVEDLHGVIRKALAESGGAG